MRVRRTVIALTTAIALTGAGATAAVAAGGSGSGARGGGIHQQDQLRDPSQCTNPAGTCTPKLDGTGNPAGSGTGTPKKDGTGNPSGTCPLAG